VTKSHWQPSVSIHDMRHELDPKNKKDGHRRQNDNCSIGPYNPERVVQTKMLSEKYSLV
jgi:hypothetical protein